MDKAIHWINQYPADRVVCFINTYLLDSDLSGGSSIIQPLKNLGQKDCIKIIEGFGGKRALGFLLKSELCQKRSKFRMQFCLRGSNNVLHFFP